MRKEIFREYDIRGIAGKDLTDESVELIGRAVGTVMANAGKRLITVGRDCRTSSAAYRDALVSGLNASGISVIDIGMVPTPALYFSLYDVECGGGVMITGSHNPVRVQRIQDLRREGIDPRGAKFSIFTNS